MPALSGQEERSQQLQQDWAILLFFLSFVGLSSCDVCCNQGIVGLCFLCHLYSWWVSHIPVLGVNVICCPHSTPGPCTVNVPKVNLPQSSCSCWTQYKSEWSSVDGSVQPPWLHSWSAVTTGGRHHCRHHFWHWGFPASPPAASLERQRSCKPYVYLPDPGRCVSHCKVSKMIGDAYV